MAARIRAISYLRYTTAAGSARPHPALQPAPGLAGDVLQERRVYRAFETDMQFADIALGEGEQPYSGESEPV